MSKQKTKYHLRKRMFLNRFTDMPAFVIGIVEDTREIADENENDWKWGDIELTLADCQRRITFSFDLTTAKERANSLYKIKSIAEVVNSFWEAVEIEAESRASRPKLVKNKKSKK